MIGLVFVFYNEKEDRIIYKKDAEGFNSDTSYLGCYLRKDVNKLAYELLMELSYSNDYEHLFPTKKRLDKAIQALLKIEPELII